MKTKERDVYYCGVRKESIQGANPLVDKEALNQFYNWLKERYKVHLQKDVLHQPKPWTQDPIIAKYRFTNVRREQDKETKWLIEHITEENLSYEEKLLNCILFRLYNKSKTLEIIGLIKRKSSSLKTLRKNIEEYKKANPTYVWFSNAFFTSGPKTTANRLFGKDLPALQMVKLVKHYQENGLIEEIKKSKDQSHVINALLKQPGIGPFLAYQLFIDFTYSDQFPFSENEYTLAGPGCKKGLKYLFKQTDNLSPEELLFWLRDNQVKILEPLGYKPHELFSDLPSYDRTLNVMSLENCMCEFSKYKRALKGEGRPRILYK